MTPSIALALVAIVLIAGVWVAPESLRPTLAITVYLVLGALLGLAPLQIGLYGILIAAVGSLALFVAQGDRLTRLQRIGACVDTGHYLRSLLETRELVPA